MLTLLWLAATAGAQVRPGGVIPPGGYAPPGDDAPGGAPGDVTIPAPFAAPDDLVFVDALSAHDRQAVAMAEEVIARGADPDVVRIAERVRDSRTRDLTMMESIRDALGPDTLTPMEPDDHAIADLELLQTLSGAELDRAFLEHLVPHDAGAVLLAHYSIDQLEHADLRNLAIRIMDRGALEIGALRAALHRLDRPEAPAE